MFPNLPGKLPEINIPQIFDIPEINTEGIIKEIEAKQKEREKKERVIRRIALWSLIVAILALGVAIIALFKK